MPETSSRSDEFMARPEDPAIYLDYAATTPCDPRVLAAMLPFFGERFGNPGSRTHPYGWDAAEAVERARRQAANLVGGEPQEIIWTSGATESNNLAILGYAGRMREGIPAEAPHVITSAIEHHSVLEPCEHLRGRGFDVTVVPPTSSGFVDPKEVEKELRDATVLVSIGWANNETGSVNDIKMIASACHSRGIALHVDGTQMVGKLPVDVREAGVDLLSWSGHKMYGPKGAGALYVRHRSPRIHLVARAYGGGQEQGLRPGTLNVPSIVGFGEACGVQAEEMEREGARLGQLRDLLEQRLVASLPTASINSAGSRRLPHITNVAFHSLRDPPIEHLKGLACSTGSACSSGDGRPSHVLLAMGLTEEVARSSLRLSLGRWTTREEIAIAASEIIRVVRELS
jgi:cysteine desulfurase